MNLEYNRLDLLEKELEALPPLHRLAFAAACCQRLLPNYNIFARVASWGDPSLLKTALDEVWQVLEGKPMDVAEIRQLLFDCSNCDKVCPHDDDCHPSEYVAEAQRATGAICYTLELCLEPTPQQAILVAKQAQDTLFEYLDWKMHEESEDDGWDKKPFKEMIEVIASHPFTVREMAKQSEDLQRLKETKTLDREFLEWLRTSFNNGGKSLIDLA